MKKTFHYSVLVVLIFLFSNILISQELYRKGAHELQKESYGKQVKSNKSLKTREQSIIALNQVQTNTLNKIVFGFLPYWEQSSSAHNNIQYELLTHLACFDFLVQLDASITPPAGWPWTTEINAAHSVGTKVVMTVVNFGGADNADAVAWELFTNTAKQNTFFENVKNLIETYSLDGVNIDFEGLTSAHRGAELNTFMANLTTYIHTELPGKEVSIDGPAVNWGGWIMDDLVDSVDYLIVMAYDYTGASDGYSGPVAPLTHHTSWKRFVTRTIETGTYAVPTANNPEKLILAVPYYGQHWKTDTNLSESSTISSEGSTRYRDTATEAAAHGGFIWNSDFQSPWYVWYDGANWNQVWADNEASISKKFDLAITNNLGGVGMWALNYDGGRPELWDLINTKFGATASLDEVGVNNMVKVFPNPAKDEITISSIANEKLKTIELYNVMGQLIMTIEPTQEYVNISNLEHGMYILKIKSELGLQESFKILKSN
ncbi:MAG: glycosyl hydrolase family 18 protein [Algibacter sp.]|uniref:glycosyl hydrolase family 18 protein n=1 Tax=Algibacter sp. TaxID=1872428 RepID=UPI0032985705